MLSSTFQDDERLLREMRRRNGATIDQLLGVVGVTRTAVRQRLVRLMSQGLVQRVPVRQQRGRPCYRYALTERAHRFFGSNLSDFASTLWEEIRGIKDPKLRQSLTQRVCEHLVDKYRERMRGTCAQERLQELVEILAERGVDAEIDVRNGCLILRQRDCPYAELTEQERSICALEKDVIARLLDCQVTWGRRRLSGYPFCEYVIECPAKDS